MTTDHFPRAVAILIDIEGGYVNHPDDPGGETKYGISKRAYPKEDIATLTVERATAIYRRDYWDKCGAAALSWPLAYYVFDFAVNGSAKRAAALAKTVTDPEEYLWARAAYYTSLKPALRRAFLSGWINRLIEIRKRVR